MSVRSSSSSSSSSSSRSSSSSNSSSILSVNSLSYGPAQLQNIQLNVARADRVALMGPNGSGKSTLLKIIHGLIPPDSGSVIKDHSPNQEAMVFQRPLLLRASVKQNLHLALVHRPLSEPDRQRIIIDALARSQLTSKADQTAQQLSGGEQQRLCLIRALMIEPRLLLLDEPTANIDPESLQSIEQLIRADDVKGQTLILATHSFAQARRLCNRVVLLSGGQIIADQTIDDFFTNPASAHAKQFIDSERF